ncbi:MAG: hypothetical protein ABFQ62_04800 [Patescibacteria group bacterium]
MRPAEYYRQNKDWKKYIGKVGIVVASTMIRVSAPEQTDLLPYSYAVVKVGKEKKEYMGVGHEKLKPGDKVKCVLRKVGISNKAGIIEYGIKVTKI